MNALSPRRLRLITILAFLGFFGIGAGWAIAMPWDGGPDEQAHITRAAGVVGGDLIPTPVYVTVPEISKPLPGTYQTVPAGIYRTSPACFAFHPKVPASCLDMTPLPAVDVHRPTKGFSATGRYQPTYHLVVGWPLRWFPDETGLLLARLLSAALSAAFLTLAVYSVLAWSRRPLLLAGLLVAATPMALHLAGVINPNGLEISAAIAMWTALIPLVLGRGPADRRLLITAGFCATVVCWARPGGPLAVAMALVILVGTAGRHRMVELARDRRAWVLGGVITVAGLTSTAWTNLMKATARVENPIGPRYSVGDSLSMVFVEGIPFYLKTMVGQFGWVDFEMPGSFHALWLGSMGFLVLAALAAGKPVDRIRLALVVAGTFAILLMMDVYVRHHNGIPVQGRYVLPVAVGLALVAAYTIDERELLARPSARAVTGWLMLALLPAHLIGLAFTMIRYQHGLYTETIPPVNPFTGQWHPELGSATALVTAVTGLAVLGAAIWLGIRDVRPSDPGSPEEGNGDERLRGDSGHAPEHVGELS